MEGTEQNFYGNSSSKSSASTFLHKLKVQHQVFLDKVTPYYTVRWVVWVLLLIVYGVRVYFLQGWYIITYALGIYLLNLFIGFLTPKIDPAVVDDDEGGLPSTVHEEYRPFLRRLPEFKFWYSAARAVFIALFCTCFDAFNIPVFWPILVMYFFVLFFMTMKRQIKHMIRYRYLPFSYGKATYRGKEDTGKSMRS